MPAVRAESRETPSHTDVPGARFGFMLGSVGLKTIWDERRSLPWWAGGSAVICALVIMLYPSIEAGPELEAMIERLPPAVQAMMGENIDLTSAAGYLNLRLFTFIAPIIFLVYAIGRGTAAIAGEEERETMDLLLSHPVKRWTIVTEKSVAMLAGLIIIGVAVWIGLIVGTLIVNVELDAVNVAEATVMAVLLGAFHGGLALVLGAGTGRTGLGMGIAAAVGIVGYFLHTLAPLVDWLEPAAMISPFYYYIDDPAMLNGLNPLHALILAVLSIALGVLAIWLFQRRDVQV